MPTREQSLREHHARRRRHGDDRHPSFSSTLLDSIYRSIDEPRPRAGSSRPSTLFRDPRTPGNKHPVAASATEEVEEEEEEEGGEKRRNRVTLGRWMEKNMRDERVVLRRNSVAAADARSRSDPDSRSAFVLSSSSSSSNSSSGGRFSSSESESTSARGGAKARSLCCDAPWPKPIRTRASVRSDTSPPPKHPPSSSSSDARFSLVKTKAKALRIYDDLKKVKQPISPGNRLASFLNSLLASKNSRKSKISSSLKQCDESAEVSTTGDGGAHDDGAPEKQSKSSNASTNAKASYGVVLERKSRYGYEKTSASMNEGIYKDAISFPQSKLIYSDALKNAKMSSSVGRLDDDGVLERKSNPECGHGPACPPLSRSRSGPSDSVPRPGDRSVSGFAKIRSVRFNLQEEDEAAAAPTRARGGGDDDVAEAVREIMARLKKSGRNESGGGSVVARDRNAEEDDGYSSSDLFELDSLTHFGHC